MNLKKTGTHLLFIVLLLISTWAEAQSEYRFIRRGNRAYQRGDFSGAEIDYRKALERNKHSDAGQFNLGGAVYQQENFEEAARIFEQLARQDISDEIKAKTFHNLGNALVNMQEYSRAVEAYKNALRLNPSDQDTKYNLLYAMQMLKNQQSQQQGGKNQQNENQQRDQGQNQQNNDSQQSGDQQAANEPQSTPQGKEQQPKQISREDAERMLQALHDRERKILDKIKEDQLKTARRARAVKDW